MKLMRKRIMMLAVLLGVCAILFGLNSVASQAIEGGPYRLSWYVAGFGGGESAGGDYTASITLGQAGAGQLDGGVYSLGGGFWGGGPRVAVFVTPTPTATAAPPGAPTATPTPTATAVPPGGPAGDVEVYLPLVDR